MKRQNAFTLVEVIVVLVILAILMALMIPALTGYIRQAQETACRTELSMLHRGAVAQALLTPEMTDDELGAALEKNYGVRYAGGGKYEKACPSGGVYTIKRDGYEIEITCDKHDIKTGMNTVLDNLDALPKLAGVASYFTSNSTSTLDSTGGNFGAPLKKQLNAALKLENGDDYDFGITYNKAKKTYTIYICDPIKNLDTAEVAAVAGTENAYQVNAYKYEWDVTNQTVLAQPVNGTVRLETSTIKLNSTGKDETINRIVASTFVPAQ